MRYPFVLAGALTAAGLVGTPLRRLVAQERNDTGAGRADRLEQSQDEPDHLMRIVMNRRARLGIKVNLQARDTDSLGAYVESVSPNGPAAKAGIRSGDVITKVGGESVLAGGRAERQRDERRSLPGLRLIELAAKLEPADTVAIELLRGKERRTVSLVTENEPDMFVQGPGEDGRRFAMQFSRPDG